jgi:hypothetical protein
MAGKQFKGALCMVKDFNPHTDVATVLIERTNKIEHLPTRYLFPR